MRAEPGACQSSAAVRLLLTLAALLGAFGCKTLPPDRSAIDAVQLEGASSIDQDELLGGLATTGTPRFLGFFQGIVFDYELYDESVLARDLERVERYYRARGYYEAKVTAARVVQEDNHVRVYVRVAEGRPVLVHAIHVQGTATLPAEDQFAVARVRVLDVDAPFDERHFDQSKQAIGDLLANRGYAFVEVTAKAHVDISHHTVDVTYEVKAGKKARYGSITVSGLTALPRDAVLQQVDLETGDEYSRSQLQETRELLVNLGLFASVEIAEDKHPERSVVDVHVLVRESTHHIVKLGGGTRIDQTRTRINLITGWEDRNFLGGLRTLTIDQRPGINLFPTRLPGGGGGDSGGFHSPSRYFFDNTLRVSLRQPSLFENRTTGLASSEYNIFPLLFPGMPASDKIIGYHQLKNSAGLERTFFRGFLYLSPTYNLQAHFPFVYRGGLDDSKPDGLGDVIVSYPELTVTLDGRDDKVRPHKGFYASTSLQAAGGVFQGDVSDVRVRPELRLFVPLAKRKKAWTLALRGTLGLLFPRNYGDTLSDPTLDAARFKKPEYVADQQKLLFRAFYSGGATSNRGYPEGGVGPHGPLGFLAPRNDNCDIAASDPPPECLRPLGGLSLWELSTEVRFPIHGAFHGVVFLDSSDVGRKVSSLNRAAPHLSTGLGFRYDTPVGPLRLDIGYRIPGLQVIGRRYETLADVPAPLRGSPLTGSPNWLTAFPEFGSAGTVFGLPLALQFAIGEVY